MDKLLQASSNMNNNCVTEGGERDEGEVEWGDHVPALPRREHGASAHHIHAHDHLIRELDMKFNQIRNFLAR